MSVRVFTIDDSPSVLLALRQALSDDPRLEVVGQARDGRAALPEVLRLAPDVITLDLAMPGEDGLSFLRRLHAVEPRRVLIVSGVADARTSVEAFRLGAVGVVPKPGPSLSRADFERRLRDAVVEAMGASPRERQRSSSSGRWPALVPPPGGPAGAPGGPSWSSEAAAFDRLLVCLGASTGGPQAIRAILSELPGVAPPVVVAVHMPGDFTRAFAESLNSLNTLVVREAEDGEPLRPGHVLVAPGDRDVEVRGGPGRFRLRLHPPRDLLCPSVDRLFESAARAAGDGAVAALLSGMGSDGALGLQAVLRAGGGTVVQDQDTSVVFGMPRAALALEAGHRCEPLSRIPAALGQLVLSRARRVRPV